MVRLIILLQKKQFENRIADGEFYEYDVHHNHYYGTSKETYE